MAFYIRSCRRIEQNKAIGNAICALCVGGAAAVLLTNIAIAALNGKLVIR